ncbi:hypothetical protein [Blastococcus brunescens]|uniref:hypothetical protein n=1 Tax=Blastococcus brunescens TaxID=1564165 RepID=UPI003BEF0D09
MTLTGYAGVLLATTAAATLTGWRRGCSCPSRSRRASSWRCCPSVSWSRGSGGPSSASCCC